MSAAEYDQDESWRQLRRNIVNAVVIGAVMSIATMIYNFIEMAHRLDTIEQHHLALEKIVDRGIDRLSTVESKTSAVMAIVADRATDFRKLDTRMQSIESRVGYSESSKMRGADYRNSMYTTK